MSQQGILADKTTSAPDIETLTGDSGGAVGADGANNVNIIGGDTTTISGNPGTNTLTVDTSVSGYPITPFVVGVSGQAGYTTVQAALDAANTAGGGTVYLQPGSYTEDLTLYDQVDLVGASGGSLVPGAQIIGIHTPPSTGAMTVRDIFLESATDIFFSAVAGSATINLIGVATKVVNGFTLNIPNWTGKVLAFNILESQSTDDGWINNSGGAIIVAKNITMGRGIAQTMVTSGTVEIANCVVDCPVDFQTGTNAVINSGSFFLKTVTYSDDSSGEAANSMFSPTTPTAAIIYNSSEDTIFTSCGVNSANNPAIDGSGSGILTFSGVDFVRNNVINSALSRAGGQSKSDSFQTINESSHLTMDDTRISGEGTAVSVNIDLIPKGSGVITSTTSIHAPSISFDSGTTVLDDYSEGTWTPILEFGGGTTGITYSTQTAQFTVIGRLCFFTFLVSLTSKGTDTGGARIIGFPFTSINNARDVPAIFYSNFTSSANYNSLRGRVLGNNTEMALVQVSDQGLTVVNVTDTNLANTTSINGTGFYCIQ